MEDSARIMGEGLQHEHQKDFTFLTIKYFLQSAEVSQNRMGESIWRILLLSLQ